MTRFVMLLALLLAPLASHAEPAVRRQPELRRVEQLVIDQTNDFRRSQGLAPTAANRQLNDTARDFAAFMAHTDRYGHEADGTEPSRRAQVHGYAYCLVSENIAYEFNTAGFGAEELARAFVEGWKRSPPHRRNMIEADAVDTGVAVARSTRSGRYYAVQMFGRPAAMRVSFRVANRSAVTLRYELGGESFQLPPRVTRTHEQCRVEVLSVHLPGRADAVRVEPAQGDRYVIERSSSGYRVARN